MRAIIWGTALLAAVYAGYWAVGSRAALAAMRGGLDALQAEGRLTYAGVSLQGFPSRFDITIDQPVLLAPDGTPAVAAEFLQILTLAYRPNKVIAVLPDRVEMAPGGQPVVLQGSGMRASVTLGASSDLPLNHAELEGNALALAAGGAGPDDALLSVGRLTAGVRPSGAGPASYDVALLLADPAPGPALRAALDPSATLPPSAEDLRAEAAVTFDRPIGRGALQTGAALTAIDAIRVTAGWGAMRLEARGSLAPDAAGLAAGRMDLTLSDWPALLAAAEGAGLLDADRAALAARVLTAMAATSPDPANLTMPLTFRGGVVSLGFVPLGPAPRLRP